MDMSAKQAAEPDVSLPAAQDAPAAAPRPKKVRRVGTVAFALLLIAAGILLLVQQFVPDFDLLAIVRFAPVLLIVLGAEVLSRVMDLTDRSTCVLFGDGAGACILNSDPENALARVQDSICKSDGSLHDLIIVGGGTSCQYKPGDPVGDDFFISMQGREVYKHAVRQMSGICQELLERNGLTAADVDLFVPHQANMRIIEAVGSRLKIGLDHVFTNVAEYGNTSSASVPLALVEAMAQGRIKAGDRVLVTAFGSGLTWGAALLQF